MACAEFLCRVFLIELLRVYYGRTEVKSQGDSFDFKLLLEIQMELTAE